MAVDVISKIEIEAPCEKVAAFASDPDNVPKWYVNIKSVEWVTERPLALGSKIAFIAHFLGRRLAYTYEVQSYVPGQHLVMRTTEGPFPMETSYLFEAASDASTRVTLRNRGEPAGFSRLVAPFMAWAMGRENRKDLARLKQILEEA